MLGGWSSSPDRGGIGGLFGRGNRLNPVHGKVMLGGQPLAGALVSFHPEDGKCQSGDRLHQRGRHVQRDDRRRRGRKPGTYKITDHVPGPDSRRNPKGWSLAGRKRPRIASRAPTRTAMPARSQSPSKKGRISSSRLISNSGVAESKSHERASNFARFALHGARMSFASCWAAMS